MIASETCRARHRRRALRPRRRAGRDGRDRRERRALDPLRRAARRSSACSSSSTSRVPTRSSTATACTARASAWARSSRARRRARRRHGDAGARVGCARRAGLRARVGHPLRRRLREEPLRRAHVHPAEPEAARRRACASSSTRCARTSRASGSSSSTTRSCAAPRPARSIALLREAGATEVHFRVSSPPYRWPCFYGLDTGKRSDLLAADMSVGEIADYLGVDSLAYLDLDRLVAATGSPAEAFCTACFTRRVPGAGARPRHQARARSRVARRCTCSAPSNARELIATADDKPLTYADAGVDIAAGEKAVELIKAHVRSTFRPEVDRRRRRLRRPVRRRLEALPRSAARVVDRRRRHEVGDRPPREPAQHDRHRLRRDVGRRHRRAGRRAAVLPRLHLDRQARARGDRRARRAASPTAAARRAARCSAARCRSTPA